MAQDKDVQGNGSVGSTEALQYATLANAASDGLFQMDENDRLIAVNDAFLDAAGRSRDELVGAPLERAFSPADADRLSAAREGLVGSDSDTVTLPASLPNANEESARCEIRLRLIDEAAGGATGCVRTSTDSTGATDEAFGSTLPTDLPGIVYRCRNERGWPMEYVSGGCESLSGHEPAALTTGEVSWGENVVDERDREAVWTDIQSALAGDDDFELEYRIQTADGETKWVTERGHAVRDESGEVAALEGFITDVTGHRETHKQLHEETEKFQSFVGAVEEYAIFMLDPEGKIASWNQGAEQIKGYDAEEALGEHFSMFYTDEDRATGVPEANLAGAAEEGSVEDEGWRVRKDGSRFWANVVITPVRDDDGTLTGYTKVTRDMTERRKNEAALRRERNLVAQILETSPVGISLVDEDNQLLRTNERAAKFAGRTPEELLELSASSIDLYDEDGRPVPPEAHPSRRVLEADESVVGGEYQIEQPDGTWRWLSIDATTIEDANEAKVVLAVQDITPLKRREAELRKERDLTERLLETSPIGIAVLTDAGQVEHVNERGQEVLGIDTPTPDPAAADAEELLLDEDGDPIPHEERPSVRAFATGEQVTDWQCQYDHPDAGRRWLSVNAAPVLDADGEVERVITAVDDITQIKEQARQLERQRDELEHELGEVFERVDDAFLALDKEWRFTYVNQKARELIGSSEQDLLGTGVWEIAPEVVDSEFHREAERALANQEAVNFEGYYAPLATWFEVSVYPSETGLSVYFRDVTERKERERELETYETIVKTVDDGVYVCDEEFRFTMVNDAYVEMTGYDREELIGAHASLVVDEDISAESADRLQEIATGEATSAAIEADINRADGSQLRAESKFTAIPSDDVEHPRKVGVVRDISERKQRERELEESRNRYQALVENFPNGAVALVDEDLRYSTVGGTPIVEADTTVAELEGSLLDEILPPDIADVLVPRYADALDGEPGAFEQEMDGHVYQFWTIPVRNDSGDVFAALGMSQDVTERKEREQFLQDAKEQLEAATEAGAVGTWEWHVPEDRFVAGTSLAKHFGVDPDAAREGVPLERLTASIHKDDRERVMAEIEAALETCGEYEAEYRTWNADDELRWVIARGHVDCDEDGNPTTFPGALTDITERKQAELQLQRNNEQLESLFEILPVGVVVADANGRLIEVNDTAKGIWGGDILDAESAEEYEKYRATWADSGEPIEPEEWTMTRVLDGEEVTDPDLFEIEAAEGERRIISAEGMPVRDENGEVTRGVVTFTDITERKERERELERYETIVEAVNDGIYVVDEDGQFSMVNEEYASMTGYDRSELLGADVSLVVDDSTAGQAQVAQREMADGERDSATLEADLFRPDGEMVPAEATFALLETDDEIERIAVVRDVTERKERERQLQTRVSQQEAITDLGQQALAEHGLDELFAEVTERVAETLDADYCKVLELLPGGEEVLLRSGVGWQDGLVGEATVDTGLNSQAGYTLRSEEPVIVDDLATESRFSGPDLLVDHDVTSGISVVIGTADDPWGVLGIHTTDERAFSDHDVNFVQSVANILATAIERADREQELERYETIVETVDDGVYALDPDGNFVLVNDAFCEMTGYDRSELIGQPGKTVTNDRIDETATQLAAEVVAGERDAATLELELQTADGQSVPVETRFGPYPYDGEQYGRTGVVRDVTERLERERALERQREELAALNRLNEVVGEITHAIVESSSREEIERLVCERLAESKSYQFAWVGEVDRATDTVALRTESGVEGYLDDVTLSADPDDGEIGPTVQAIQTREPQVVWDTMDDPDYDPWRNIAAEYDFRSSAAIPIVYEDVLYGVLNVYSGRVGAFDGYEQALLARLGNVVGHTINALERKEALMSDQVQEIDFEIADIASFVDEPVPTEGTITFERTVLVGDDTYLQYGTADGDAMALLEGLVEALPSWEELAILDERFGEVSFELRLSEPPVISTMATYGGRVQSAIIEDGHYRMRVELPPAADVRTVVEALKKEYPSIELVAQRRTARDAWSVRRIDDLLEEQLTDRQRASLKAAYYAGYFDTPRKRSGEAVAESLEITAPTLHQHLRKGQRKLLAAVFDDSEIE